jgi:hypothetical protein
MKIFVLTILICVAAATEIKSSGKYVEGAAPLSKSLQEKREFMSYGANMGKSYKTVEEFNLRLGNFLRTDTFIRAYNDEFSGDSSQIRLGHNKFSDWNEEELAKLTPTKPGST